MIVDCLLFDKSQERLTFWNRGVPLPNSHTAQVVRGHKRARGLQ